MLLSNFSTPQQSIILVGSNIIQVIKAKNIKNIEISSLYSIYSEEYKYLSYSYFMLGLDFLYMIGYLELNSNGDLIICN